MTKSAKMVCASFVEAKMTQKEPMTDSKGIPRLLAILGVILLDIWWIFHVIYQHFSAG